MGIGMVFETASIVSISLANNKNGLDPLPTLIADLAGLLPSRTSGIKRWPLKPMPNKLLDLAINAY
jgi:hypothetical protein